MCLIPFTVQGNPADHTHVECACGNDREACQVGFMWTTVGEEEPRYYPICAPCILPRVSAGNC